MTKSCRSLSLASILIVALSACSLEGDDVDGVWVGVDPENVEAGVGEDVTFSSRLSGTLDSRVLWEVVEPAGGTVDASGRYTAPPSPGEYHVKVSALANPAAYAVASVTVTTGTSGTATGTGTCAAEPLRPSGTTYYYCDCAAGSAAGCVPGSDSNPGTSPAAPRRTGFKSRFATMGGGDTVALCRGGSFPNDSAVTRNANCRATATCDMRDYTPSARPEWASDQTKRPILVGGRIGYFPDNGTHYEGFRFLNLASTGSGEGSGVFYVAGDVTDGDICNVHIHDGVLGLYWADPVNGAPITKRWKLRHSRFERLTSQGILGGCTDCVVDRNYFANDSFGANTYFDHPLYVSAPSGYRIDRMKITNNEVHGCRPGTTMGTILLVVHGEHEDLLIENNLIQCDNPVGVSPNQWGIGLNNGGYPSSVKQGYTRTIIRRNRIIGQVGHGIELSQAPDSLVEANVIQMTPASSASSGIHTAAYTRRSGSLDALNERITFRNNTISFPFVANQWEQYGIHIGSEGSGYVVTNNAVHYSGGLSRCFSYPLASSAYSTLSNNACNGTWGTGYDSNRVTFSGSPFVSGTDFTPAAGSPLVDAGASTSYSSQAIGSQSWSATDTGRMRDGSPDIGAYER